MYKVTTMYMSYGLTVVKLTKFYNLDRDVHRPSGSPLPSSSGSPLPSSLGSSLPSSSGSSLPSSSGSPRGRSPAVGRVLSSGGVADPKDAVGALDRFRETSTLDRRVRGGVPPHPLPSGERLLLNFPSAAVSGCEPLSRWCQGRSWSPCRAGRDPTLPSHSSGVAYVSGARGRSPRV